MRRLDCLRPAACAALAALLSTSVAGSAAAQSAGQWTARVGVGKVSPRVHSGDLSAPALPGSKADLEDDVRPVFALGYGLTDQVAVTLDAGVPFRLDVTGAGAIAGTGKLASVRAMAPTLFLQYRAGSPGALLRPYAGIGLSYARFFHERGSGQLTALADTGGAPVTFSLDRRFAPTAQAGLTVDLGEHWFTDLVIARTRLRTVAHLSTGQTLRIRIDPTFAGVSLGVRF